MKNINLIYLSSLLVLFLAGSCQPLLTDSTGEIRQSKSYGDTLVVFGVASFQSNNNFNFEKKNKKINTSLKDDQKIFHSFRLGNLQKNQGSYTGKPLQGNYEKFLRKQLIQKGSFNEGLKDGKWYEWSPKGKLKSITEYKNGLKNGYYKLYDIEGNVIETGKFKNSLKHGSINILSQDSSYFLLYKNDVIVDTLNTKKKKLPFFNKK